MKMQFTRIAAALAIAALALPLSAKEFRSSDVHPEDYPTVMAVKYMSDIIKQKTGGKDSIKVYVNSTLGSEKDTIEQTKIGALDMVRVNVAPFNNIVPATIVPSLPFLFKSKEHMRRVLDGPIGDEILAAMEAQGFIGLAFYDSGSRSFYSGKKAIKNVADTKGMKIRVQQSDLWVALLQAMGANATPIPYAEVYTALKTGVVDGAENNEPTLFAQNHYQTPKGKVYSLTGHLIIPEIFVYSKASWDKLPKADQDLIKKFSREAQIEQRGLWDAYVAEATGKLKAAGVKFVPADKEAFFKATQPVRDKYGAKYASLIQRIRDTK